MRTVGVGVFVLASVVLGVLVVDPFLQPPKEYIEGKIRALSNPARAGYNVYAANCSFCHGALGGGSDAAPALTGTATASRFYDRAELHRALAKAITAHEKALPGGRADGVLDFNEVELMGKFLREFARREQALAG